MNAREWVWAPALISAGMLGPGLATAPPAAADGYLSAAEARYVADYGPTAICPVVDSFPTTSGVLGVIGGIASDGFTPSNAVDIINAAVWEYCPQHWPLLVAIGDNARTPSITAATERI